jgi:hypothetical protein
MRWQSCTTDKAPPLKIIVPAVRYPVVGTTYVDKITYFYDGRPPVSAFGKTTAVREPELYEKTLFDYDFKAKRRLIAAGALTLMAPVALVVVPLVLTVSYVVTTAIRVVVAVKDAIVETLNDISDDARAIHPEIVGAFKTAGSALVR